MPEVQSPRTVAGPATPAADEASNGFVSRADWLAQAGKLKELVYPAEGLGKLLLTEITGAARAAIQSQSATGLLADVKRLDVAAYQRALLLAGVVDPSSPEGARKPLFSAGDMDTVMAIGGGKIAAVIEEIEKLSALGPAATGSAEKNSEATPSAAGISG